MIDAKNLPISKGLFLINSGDIQDLDNRMFQVLTLKALDEIGLLEETGDTLFSCPLTSVDIENILTRCYHVDEKFLFSSDVTPHDLFKFFFTYIHDYENQMNATLTELCIIRSMPKFMTLEIANVKKRIENCTNGKEKYILNLILEIYEDYIKYEFNHAFIRISDFSLAPEFFVEKIFDYVDFECAKVSDIVDRLCYMIEKGDFKINYLDECYINALKNINKVEFEKETKKARILIFPKINQNV